MTTLLSIKSSLNADGGQSNRLVDRYVANWRAAHPDGSVIVRDLARDPVPHLDGARFAAFLARPAERTDAQRAVVDQSDALIDELKRADVVVLGLPLYNLGVPSTLKAYFDHIARAGVTFRYTESGPVGLLADRKVVVLAARGGKYAGTARDTQTPYVRDFLALLGLRDVEFVHAEGLAIDAATRNDALARAQREIERLVDDDLTMRGEPALA